MSSGGALACRRTRWSTSGRGAPAPGPPPSSGRSARRRRAAAVWRLFMKPVKMPLLDVRHAPGRRPLVIVGVVAVPGQRRVGVGGDEGRGHALAHLVIAQAAQEPGAPGVGRLHLEGAIQLDRMADDLVREQGVVVGIRDDDDLALGGGQGRGLDEGQALAGQGQGELREGRIRRAADRRRRAGGSPSRAGDRARRPAPGSRCPEAATTSTNPWVSANDWSMRAPSVDANSSRESWVSVER